MLDIMSFYNIIYSIKPTTTTTNNYYYNYYYVFFYQYTNKETNN